MITYGKELILDLHECDPSTFTRKSIRKFFKELCELIDMERCKLCWWDDYGLPPEECQTKPHLKGTTAVQFIKTSNITIHTLDLLKSVYLNIFSCKDFDLDTVKQFSESFFQGKIVNNHVIERK
jgi:S-adenosylmethionine/arginine decarboxylase-like enzyme